MAENVGFRVGFRGFNKQDVLTYIDTMQVEAQQRLTAEEQRRAQTEEKLEAAEAQTREAERRVAEIEQELADKEEQFEQVTSLAQMYKSEILQLRGELDAKAQDSQDLVAANDRIRQLEEQVSLMAAQNERYAQIVGDVNRIVVEARVVSASYLDAAQRQSADCLKELEAFLESLKEKTVQAARVSDDRRQLGGERIETLLTDLQNLGQSPTEG